MPLIALALVPVIVLAFIALMPLSIVLRYRAGTARRLARGWVATINVLGIAFSTAVFLGVAAATSAWVPNAFTYSVIGLAGGCVLGLLGLWLSRWEGTPQSLHYTPNRWLVLAITLVVTSRLIYGFWRGWHTWGSTPDDTSWLAASGAAGSLGAGAVVLGYYLTYLTGVLRRLKQHGRKLGSPNGGSSPASSRPGSRHPGWPRPFRGRGPEAERTKQRGSLLGETRSPTAGATRRRGC
jgi:hypothetical protein